LPELAAWIDKVLVEANLPYEIIFIDDGSTDNSWNIIEKLAVNNPKITGIKFRRNYGKSPALHVGFRKHPVMWWLQWIQTFRTVLRKFLKFTE
jgi:glycosyltransferase involved in cell wall biosynthesis